MTIDENNYKAVLREKVSAAVAHKTNRAVRLNKAIAAALLKVSVEIPLSDRRDRTAAYFSAEYLPGKLTEQTVAALSLETATSQVLKELGSSLDELFSLPDPALGNGGLGRLAACIMESAASCDITLDGYGIRYRHGLFKQYIDNMSQAEEPENWQSCCPFEKRRDDCAVKVKLGDGDVLAVPYDIPIIGSKRINRLRLWQCEPIISVDFKEFAKGNYEKAYKNYINAEAVSAFLYPDDTTTSGKELRLKQQYFFSAASIDSILKDFSETGLPISSLSGYISIQLNDTHPTVAVPELLRRLCEDFNTPFELAFTICRKIFSYTNHTVMAEALESWDISLFSHVLPHLYPYIVMINNTLMNEITVCETKIKNAVILNGRIYMANLAVFCSKKVNGVAEIHTDIIKNTIFKEWNALYPQKIINITNGVSHRRWLCLANAELASFIDERIGTSWREEFSLLKEIESFTAAADIESFHSIKQEKKEQLCNYIRNNHGMNLSSDFIFSVQIKRIHEYKRQLMNILSVLDIYLDIKNSKIKNCHPIAFIFAGKAAPGYYAAKEIIRLINTVSAFISSDTYVRNLIKICFIPDYNVKNAMKIIPAADLSEQISMATTEASGTGNMKLAMNGAPTIGTMDGANIEIVKSSGKENNYIFGADSKQIEEVSTTYNPFDVYNTNEKIRDVLELLKEDSVLGNFESIYNSLLSGGDRYRVLMDLPSYTEARLKAIDDYKNTELFATKGIKNIAGSSLFSSDRTVSEYYNNIWK